MRTNWSLPVLAAAVFGAVGGAASCTDNQKIAGVMQEIKTIRSHSVADAEAIPYAPECYRVFTITYVEQLFTSSGPQV